VSVTFVHSVKTNKDIFDIFFHHRVAPHHSSFSMPNGIAIFRWNPLPPLNGASNAGGVGRNRDSEPKSGLTACVNAVTGQVLSTRSPVDHGHRLASYDTSLVVSGGVDCGRRRQNVYDKKPQRYANDNRTAHLTARSEKSVAYVTNNKSLYSTFCTVEANYWQTRSIARPLCDSRAILVIY